MTKEELEKENAELKKDRDYFSDALDKQVEATLELQKKYQENELHKQDYSLFDFVMKYENGKFKCEYKSGKVFESVDGETWKEIVLPKEIKEK